MTAQSVDLLLVAVLVLNFFVLLSTRLRSVVFAVAAQGLLLAAVYPVAHLGAAAPLSPGEEDSFAAGRLLALAAVMAAVKGFIIPRMLFRAVRRAEVRGRVESLLGVAPTLLLGAVGTALAVAFAGRLPLKPDHGGHLVVGASLATVLAGFLLLATHRQALMQVVGYIVLENGVFIFGLLLVDALPFLVEVGVLLDLFVGVFVMEIIIHHISRALPEASAEHLSALRE